jgi:hypothetical protein
MDILAQVKPVSVRLRLVLVCVIAAGCSALQPLPPHQGDGFFDDTSWRFPYRSVGVPVWGFQVVFPEFCPGEAYDAEFQVSGLPQIGRKVGVYLLLSSSGGEAQEESERQANEMAQQEDQVDLDTLQTKFKDELTAVWEFEVCDSQDHVITSVAKPLSELTWSTPSRERGYGIYSFSSRAGDGSHFHTRENECYTLRVRYRPDERLRPFRARIYLQCGGSI